MRRKRLRGREPCDQKAIHELGNALDKVGRRREAVNAYTSFSATCGHHAPSLRAAINMLLTLSDYQRAASVASDLIALEPFSDNGYFLRALAYDRGGSTRQAIDDYVTAIELFGNKQQIASVASIQRRRISGSKPLLVAPSRATTKKMYPLKVTDIQYT